VPLNLDHERVAVACGVARLQRRFSLSMLFEVTPESFWLHHDLQRIQGSGGGALCHGVSTDPSAGRGSSQHAAASDRVSNNINQRLGAFFILFYKRCWVYPGCRCISGVQ